MINKTIQLIDKLAATTKRTEKEQLLVDAFMTGERTFFIGARMAYDFSVTYGFKKVAEIMEDDGVQGTLSLTEFCATMNRLRRRELTGNAAKAAVNDMAERCDFQSWNKFYRKIILRDFSIGIDIKTINKILKKLAPTNPDADNYTIPVFSCQLAKDAGGGKVELKGKKFIDAKIDGTRMLAFLDKESNSVTLYTRTGKEITSFPKLAQELFSFMTKVPKSVVLDGEIRTIDFQDTMMQINTKGGGDESTAKFALFDMIPLSDFLHGECKIEQFRRHEALVSLETELTIKQETHGRVFVLPKMLIDLDTVVGQQQLSDFNRQAIKDGYEGIMVKDPLAGYELKRSKNWLKIKPFIEVSLRVVDVLEGDENGENKGKVGSLKCSGYDDGMYIEVNVGTGISDVQRIEWWNNPSLIVDMIVEVRADKLSLEKNGTVYSLRFPTFKGIRGTVAGEKI